MAVRAERGARRRRAARRGARARHRLGAFGVRCRRAAPAASLVGLFAAAAVVSTAPAVAHFGSSFIATPAPGYGEAAAGDHLQSVYRFWLVGHQLERGAPPWLDPLQFQPLASPQVVLAGWPFGLVFWPLDALFGPVVAWNVLLLAGIVVAGLATVAWLRALGLGRAAATAGGLAFALAPYRLMQSGGHLLGWLAILLPVVLVAYERARAAPPGRRRTLFGAAAALALAAIPLSGQVHLALGALPLAVLYAAVRFRLEPFLWVLGGAVVGGAGAVAIQQTLIEDSVLAGGGRTLDQIELFQATWSGFVDRFGLVGAEQDVYLGWLVPAAALVGFAILVRRAPRLGLLAAVAALVPILLAVGTHLPTYAPLFHALPPFRYPRVPERLLPLANLALAALLAVALAWALRRLAPRWRRLGAAAAILLVAGDLLVLPFRAGEADPANAAYAALAGRPAGRTIELPVFEPGIHYGSIYDYYAMQAPRERPSGYSTLAPDPPYAFFWRYDRLNCGIWRPSDLDALRALGVRDLLFHLGAYEQSGRANAWLAWQALERLGLRATARGGDVWLFPLTEVATPRPAQPPPAEEPPRDQPILCEAWRDWAMVQHEAGLWLYGSGPMELEVSAPMAATAWLEIDGGPPESVTIDGSATIALELRGERWHLVVFSLPALFDTDPPRGLRLERVSYGAQAQRAR